MMSLENLVQNHLKSEKIWFERVNKSELNKNKFAGNFYFLNEKIAILKIKEGEFGKSRMHFSNCGELDEFRIANFNFRIFDYGLIHISYVLLSDHEELIQKYAKLRYQRAENAELSMDEMVAIGELPIWCNTVQFFMENNTKGIERNLNIIETITLKNLPKKEEGLRMDYEFYKALLYKDKGKCEEILEQLVSPKVHKRRNDNSIINKYISNPATGYAKLAWRAGLEVDIDSHLIPKELLPINPNELYEIPYDFLK